MNTFQLKKVKGLGRGLSSLLGDTKSKTNITKLKIYDVKRNRLQPRKVFNKESLEELTNSIKERGVIQPIIVRKDKNLIGKFEIIAGERRWLASQNAGLHEIPVVILDVNDEKSLEFAIVENIQRQDLNAIEEAQGYQRLIDEFSYNQDKLAKFIGKSRSHIANCLRLLNLPSEVISYVEKEKIEAFKKIEISAFCFLILIGLKGIKKCFWMRNRQRSPTYDAVWLASNGAPPNGCSPVMSD